ncbi:MAG: Triose-phosphate Transporter [Trizodia sp. TS-e1964]|nr:MAG: Triose-phosphate Transporter [Trizodia sp. TS-e1964]
MPESGTTVDDVELEDLLSAFDSDEETGLTLRERRGERKRSGDTASRQDAYYGPDLSKDEKRLAEKNFLKKILKNAALIASWYLFSLSISIYNKWMFSKEHLNFHFPLFTTCMHMLVQFFLASLILYLFPRFRPTPDVLGKPQGLSPGGSKMPLMTRMFYFTRIGPCGAATGLDIGLGNMSLKYISLTFYTMCKSSALAFVLLFAFLFRLETPSIVLVTIIAAMTAGVVMMVAGETAFRLIGFVLVISASFFSGFRWALTQILLLRNPATSNPFSSIFFLAPIMFISLLVIAVPVEGPFELATRLTELYHNKGTILGTAILLFPGIMAFLMISSEFALLQRTSVVTLSICGIFKEVITISAAAFVFHDPLTSINVSGLLVTIASIAAYNFIKIRKMRADTYAENAGYAALAAATIRADTLPLSPRGAASTQLTSTSAQPYTMTPEDLQVYEPKFLAARNVDPPLGALMPVSHTVKHQEAIGESLGFQHASSSSSKTVVPANIGFDVT